MASWTAPTIYVTGNTLTVTAWNALANDATFLYQAPYGRAWNTVATTLVTNTATQISLGGSTLGYGFTISSNNLVVPIAGIYVGSYQYNCTSTSAEQQANLYQNGAAVATSPWGYPSGYGTAAGGTVLVKAAASDTLGLYGYNTYGSNLPTNTGSALTYVHMAFIGSQ